MKRIPVTLALVFCVVASAWSQQPPEPQEPQAVPPQFQQALEDMGLDAAVSEQVLSIMQDFQSRIRSLQRDRDERLKELLGDEPFQTLMQSMRPGPRRSTGRQGEQPQGPGGGQGDPWGPPGGDGMGPGGDPWGPPGGEGDRPGGTGQGWGPPEGGSGQRPGGPMEGDPRQRRLENCLKRMDLAPEEEEVLRPALEELAALEGEVREAIRGAREELHRAIEEGGTDEQLEAAIARLATVSAEKRAELGAAEEELRSLVTTRQQAILIELGFLGRGF